MDLTQAFNVQVKKVCPEVRIIGYEPKWRIIGAMSMVRASSTPANGNPFWSDKVRGEWELAQSRPENLPIPHDNDLEDPKESIPLEKGEAAVKRKERSRSGERGRGKGRGATGSEAFRTPPGKIEELDEIEESGGRGRWGTGRSKPKESLEEAMSREVEEWMRREAIEMSLRERQEYEKNQQQVLQMKEENMAILREQNRKLLDEVERLRLEKRVMAYKNEKQSSGVSEWSAISPEVPMAQSPVKGEEPVEKSFWRFTPGGTRIPDGPPPPDEPMEVPEFPKMAPPPPPSVGMVRDAVYHGDRAWHGGRGLRDGRARDDRALHGGQDLCDGRGLGDRAWHGERDLCGGGEPGDRAWHGSSVLCAGIYGGDRAEHEDEKMKDERATRLEREVEALKEQLMQQAKSMDETSWSAPRMEEERKKGEKVDLEDRTEDSLRSFPIVLPRLPEPSIKNSSLEAGDWLTQVRPLIADVSTKAILWWDQVVEATFQQYRRWLAATPLERLRIPAPEDKNLSQGFQRLAQRVSVMMMQALPEGLKQEMIAMRQMDVPNILFKVFKTFQPGGLTERKQMLAELTTTTPSRTASEAVAALRLWKRQAQRASELRATMPDVVLQVKALSTIMESLLAKDTQANFRVNAYRMQNGIDVAPSEADIDLFFELLLSEAEQMVTSNQTGQEDRDMEQDDKKDKPSIKMVGGASTSKGCCHYWGSTDGCRLGRRCRFGHDWQALQDRHTRCWICSSTKHMKSECPHREEALSEGQSKGSTGGSEDNGGGKAKGKKGKKGKGKGKQHQEENSGKGMDRDGAGRKEDKSGGENVANNANGTSTSPATPSVKEIADPKPCPTAPQGSNDELMSEVTSLLRSLRMTSEAEPRMRVCQVKKLRGEEKAWTLLDGGATHCLRMMESEEEWMEAIPVKVQLAAGEAEMRQDARTQTLICREPVQQIIPMIKIIDLGYAVAWSKSGCSIEHAHLGKIPVEMHQGCPNVPEEWGKKLMKEVEEAEERRIRVRAILQCGVLAENEQEKRVAGLKSRYPEVPDRILERMPGEAQWDVRQVPVNRRRRRQIDQAKKIIIDMFAGGDKKRWQQVESNETVVVSIDVLQGLNVMDPHVSGWIDSLIDTGKVVMWLSGPPCRTISALRNDEDGGPPCLRLREGSQRFGKEGLTGGQQELADHDATLWIKNLDWMEKVKRRNDRAEVLLEQPSDPREWKKDGAQCPSFLAWPETMATEKRLGTVKTRMDQGAAGHVARKPTTFINDIPEIQALQGLCAQDRKFGWSSSVEERVKESKSLASWAPGVVEVLKHAMRRVSQEATVKTLSTKERQEVMLWQEHFKANHVPHRRDCLTCMESMGRDRHRKKIQNPQNHTMSVDIAGPFEPGVDQEISGARYLLLATVTIPMKEGKPLPEGLIALGGQLQQRRDLPPLEDEEQKEDKREEDKQEESPVPGELDEAMEVVEEDQQPLTEVEVKEMDKANQRWKEFLGEAREMETRAITWGVPLKSRATKDVVAGVAKSLQIIVRLHCDRAREFVSAEFQRWAEGRDMQVTFCAGDEPTLNGRIEREIGIIKARTRLLLRSARAPITYWPLAARHALEERCRQQLWNLGVVTAEVLPFGCVAAAKKKTWENRSQPWKWPFQKVRCWGPASDMSMTSRGHFIQTEDGRFMRSTIIVVPSKTSEMVRKAKEGQEALEQQEDGALGSTDHALGSVEDATRDVGKLDEGEPKLQKEDENHETEENIFEVPEHEIVIEEPQKRDILLVHQHDQPRFRLREKSAPAQLYQKLPDLSFHELQERGEDVMVSKMVKEEEESREEDDIAMMRAMEHWGMRQVVQEEAGQLMHLEGCQDITAVITEVMTKATKEIEELERQLKEQQGTTEAKIRSLTKEVEEQVLQTRVIPTEEVKQDLEKWKPAFEKEVNSLISGPVVPVSAKEVQDMKDKGMEIEILPMKAIASKKPPDRLKARIVVCGNFSEQPEGENISVGGACAQAIRCVCHTAAVRRWGLGSIDVTGAFLQAPRRPRNKVTLTEPPSVLKDMQLVGKDTKWRVECALYGLQESPSDWASFRTAGLKELRWEDEHDQYTLEETAEKHIWKVKGRKDTMEGVIAVYVDDFLVAMPEERLAAAFQAIKKKWRCSDEEIVNTEKSMRFCGYEIKKKQQGGFWLSQSGYLADVLKKRNVEGVELQPCPKLEPGPDEEEDWKSLKEAQMVVGEVMWLAGRTRPDIAFTTGAISRMLHRRPRYACLIAQHLLRYLNGTRYAGLDYVEKIEDRGKVEGCEEVKKGLSTMEVMADVSYGPETEQYKSVQGIIVEHNSNILFWESVRQPMVALSTCESELIGYLEGYTAGEGIAQLLTELEFNVTRCLFGDNKAALAVCGNETGGWRTRHLRIRASRLREILRDGGAWKAAHLRGTSLSADGMTKPLNGQAFQRFFAMIGMKKDSEDQVGKLRRLVKRDQEPRRKRCDYKSILMALGGLVLMMGQRMIGALLMSCAQLMKQKEKEQEGGSLNARVCAFRLKEEKKEEGRQAAPKSTAKQRGLAALDQPKKDEVTVSVDALTEEFDVTVNVTARRKTRVEEKEGYGVKERQEYEGTSRCSASEVASESGMSSWTNVTENREERRRKFSEELRRGQEVAAEARRVEPWKLRRFAKEPSSGSDVWDETLLAEGWLVRIHKKKRVNPFHPLHRSTPIRDWELSSERTTMMFQDGKCKKILRDEWNDPGNSRIRDPTGQWNGYTFFRLKEAEDNQDQEEVSQGSFEKIQSEEEG